MFRHLSGKKFRNGGFVLVELAITLPLLILLVYGLATVSIKIFQLGKNQSADYVLEEEAHYIMERITHQARTAKSVDAYNEFNSVKFMYHTSDDGDSALTVNDVWETQYFLAHQKKDSQAITLYAKRHDDGIYLNPITGDNNFGETTLVNLKFSELNENVLHITLELESLVTGRRIKLSTAVYMPACESKTGLPHE